MRVKVRFSGTGNPGRVIDGGTGKTTEGRVRYYVFSLLRPSKLLTLSELALLTTWLLPKNIAWLV